MSDLDDFKAKTLTRMMESETRCAYTVGYERYTGSLSGGPVQEVVLRVTHIFRREQGEWKVVHRHGNNAGPDQIVMSTEGRP